MFHPQMPMAGNMYTMPNPYVLQNQVVQNPRVFLENQSELGQRLAKTRWSRYCEGLDAHQMRQTAIMLENTQAYLKSLDETTLQQQVGNFDKFAKE